MIARKRLDLFKDSAERGVTGVLEVVTGQNRVDPSNETAQVIGATVRLVSIDQ